MSHLLPEFPQQGVSRLLGLLPDRLKSPVQALAAYASNAFLSLQQALQATAALQAENRALREEVEALKGQQSVHSPIAIAKRVRYLADAGAGGTELWQRRPFTLGAAEDGRDFTEAYVRHVLNTLRATDAAMGEMERRLTTEIGRLEDLLENERSLLALADQDFERVTELLRATALALKGAPAPGTSHSWNDLPVVARLTRLAAKRALR